jgi:hypothetical protein
MTEFLFYGGLLAGGLAILSLVVAAVLLGIRRRRLFTKLEEEYGKRIVTGHVVSGIGKKR